MPLARTAKQRGELGLVCLLYQYPALMQGQDVTRP